MESKDFVNQGNCSNLNCPNSSEWVFLNKNGYCLVCERLNIPEHTQSDDDFIMIKIRQITNDYVQDDNFTTIKEEWNKITYNLLKVPFKARTYFLRELYFFMNNMNAVIENYEKYNE